MAAARKTVFSVYCIKNLFVVRKIFQGERVRFFSVRKVTSIFITEDCDVKQNVSVDNVDLLCYNLTKESNVVINSRSVGGGFYRRAE